MMLEEDFSTQQAHHPSLVLYTHTRIFAIRNAFLMFGKFSINKLLSIESAGTDALSLSRCMHACIACELPSVLYRRHFASSLFGCCDVYFLLNLTDPCFQCCSLTLSLVLCAIFPHYCCAVSTLWFNSFHPPFRSERERLCQWNIYLYSPRTTVITHLFVSTRCSTFGLCDFSPAREWKENEQLNVEYTCRRFFSALLEYEYEFGAVFHSYKEFNPPVLWPLQGLNEDKKWNKQLKVEIEMSNTSGAVFNCQLWNLYCFIR